MIPESGIGGFYGMPVGGFDHYKAIGRTTLLSRDLIKSDFLITLELARNYLHDCIHHCTFKSYSWNREKEEAYRYQYGINYRSLNGISYSRKTLS